MDSSVVIAECNRCSDSECLVCDPQCQERVDPASSRGRVRSLRDLAQGTDARTYMQPRCANLASIHGEASVVVEVARQPRNAQSTARKAPSTLANTQTRSNDSLCRLSTARIKPTANRRLRKEQSGAYNYETCSDHTMNREAC